MAAAAGDLVRPAEWRRVREFAAGVRDAPSGLALQGEAGAGKSTLWRAGVDAATAAGHRLLHTEPSASETDLSFAGLFDLLSGVLPAIAAQIPGPQLEALEIALLLRPAGEQPPTSHAISLAVLAALRACQAAGPVLIAIDDAQWLDEASRDALAFALRRVTTGPLSLLVAARTEAVADPLTAGTPPPARGWQNLLAALPAAETIDLAPLDMWQIQNLLPATVSAAQAREIARQSRGNPFWAKEIAANLDSGDCPVPPLARTLTDRLASTLSAQACDALAAVAAAGRTGISEALAVLDHLADPAAAIDAAVLAGVVVESGDRLAAAHPLIGVAAVECLPPGRRMRLYQRLAEVSANPERYAHFAALAAGPGPDQAVAEALDAAAAAAHGRAANAAAGQFAARAVEFTPHTDADALVRRRIRAAELLDLAGDGKASLDQLAPLDMSRLDTPDLERALPVLLDTTDTVHGEAAATTILSEAVNNVGAEPRRRALVLALASDVVYGIRGRRRAAATEAIRCAQSAGSAAAASEHRALLNLLVVKIIAGEGMDGRLLERAELLEATMPVRRLHDSADLYRGVWSRFVEDLDTARLALQRAIGRARETDDDHGLVTFLYYLASTEELAGDYAAASAAVDAAGAIDAWYDWPPSPWHLQPRCELLIANGNLDEALSLVDEHLPDTEQVPVPSRFVGCYVRGMVSSWLGDPAAAASQFERAVNYAEQRGWVDPGVRHGVDSWLAETYVVLRRTAEAARIAAFLRAAGERLGRPVLTGNADRIAAQVAAEAGELDNAAELARAAVAAHRSSPLRLELADSLLVLGQIERRRKARNQSREALRAAFELATEMGHRPMLAQIQQELPRTDAARAGDKLTATERQVANLIASGATNRQAAAELFISVRTVETHVAAIYRKLGVRTRAELARRLAGASGPRR
jgi:DNA-binding CsgD family transcriptional regulator/tetratricopeptide (TPR) repeat protein